MKSKYALVLSTMIVLAFVWQAEGVAGERHLYVDAARGSERALGSQVAPLKSLYAAIKRLPKEVGQDVTIHISAGNYESTGGMEAEAERLELNRRMREGAKVRIVGNTADFDKAAPVGSVVLDWPAPSSGFMMVVNQGHWTLENIQLGTRKPGQRHGISVGGPALLELHNVRIHTRSFSGPGVHAHHGGRIGLYGRIELNEDLHEDRGEEESFCGIEAEYSGTIKFMERKSASLSIGNGSLSARYYGVIELGCERAQVTSWHEQANVIAINNSGRVDLHNTTTRLCARNPRNTPIGLEHDGHVLAEGARIIIDGQGNSNAIVLQKASSFFCNDVEIHGQIRHPLLAMSGSILLAGIDGDLGETFATTCASIIIEKCTGNLIGPFKQTKFGRITLPEGKQPAGAGKTNERERTKPRVLPALHQAAFGGHAAKVRQLIKQGADVRAKGPNDRTTLQVAAMGGHRMTSEALLESGADIQARNEQGCSPAELAQIYGHNALTDFLRKESKADQPRI